MKHLAALFLVVAAALGATTTSTPAGRAPVCGPYLNVPRESTPQASRDGRFLVWTQTDFRRPTAFIQIGRPDGTGERRVVPGRLLVDSIAVAPDGSEVLVQSHQRLETGWILVSTQVPTSRSLRADEVREIRRRWRTPEWSPDGRLVVEAGENGVWITSPDDGSRRRVSDLRLSWGGAWSPDGTQIAFNSADGNAGGHLYVVNPDGTGLRRLTQLGSVTRPEWSPDGRWIAFTRDHSNYHEGSAIAVVRPDGTGLRFLTRAHEGPDQRSAGFVSWLNATRLVFVSDERRQGRRKVAGIHSIDLDGRNERRVTYHCHLGTPANDILRGSILGDTLRSLAGADEVVPGPGKDEVDSGAGADLIRARDRERDVVRCGPGRDLLIADRPDHAARDCERVVRK